jgi:hypothetical protein
MGLIEIFSAQPNAFGKLHLLKLQAMLQAMIPNDFGNDRGGAKVVATASSLGSVRVGDEDAKRELPEELAGMRDEESAPGAEVGHSEANFTEILHGKCIRE